MDGSSHDRLGLGDSVHPHHGRSGVLGGGVVSAAEVAVQIGRALWTTTGANSIIVTRQAITVWIASQGWYILTTGEAGQMWGIGQFGICVGIPWELDDVTRSGVLDRIAIATGREPSDLVVEIAARQGGVLNVQ
jgi:hypothetical protein